MKPNITATDGTRTRIVERVRATLISGDGWAPGMGPWAWSSRKPETVSGRAERMRGVVWIERVRRGVRLRPTRAILVAVEVNIVYVLVFVLEMR